jgi:hypothetical protein
MARYTGYDSTQPVLLPVSFEHQLLPGTLEVALQVLVERRLDTASFASRDKHEGTGCRAYDPKIVLKVIVLASARGSISARKIEQACRENIPFMALACGQTPAHSTLAAFVVPLKAVHAPFVGAQCTLWCRRPRLHGVGQARGLHHKN